MTIRFRFSKSDLITTAGVAMRPLERRVAGSFDRAATSSPVGFPAVARLSNGCGIMSGLDIQR